MLLPAGEAALLFKLHCALMQFVNEQLKVVGVAEAVTPYTVLAAEQRRQVAQAFVSRLDLIDAFITANPARLDRKELEIVSSWRHLVSGRFIALRQLKNHMILLACHGTPTAYAVVGLVEPLERVIPNPLPTVIETVLLPFSGKITYDGIISLSPSRETSGPGSRRAFEEEFRMAKANNRVVTSLPEPPAQKPRGDHPKPKLVRPPGQVLGSPRQVLTEVVGMTDAFCQERLTEEYAVLCRKLAEKLAGKRPSPLVRGQPATWAVGILRTVGWVNFLDDRTQSPYLKLREIDRAFGVAESTGQGKAKAIRRLLKIHQFDHRWMLPSRWEGDPMIWTLQDSRGLMVDIRQQPVTMQRAAFRQGLIPYVPADRAAAAVRAQVAASSSRRLFQFKIALRGIEPLVWRRIQVLDDTLDRLHEHFQTAMGWTNSHLHEFLIQGRRYGDPELLHDDVEPLAFVDSTRTLISAVMPEDGTPIAFEYHYDFGDCWMHEVLFEGCPPQQPGMPYPQCLEGERACPPEDVGGIPGYAEYLEAMADPSHARHQEMLDWRGAFDPNAFNARLTTHVMQEGMPEWRRMAD